MKKLLVLVLVSCFTLGLFAQEAADLKNAGNAALRSKNYVEALAKFEQYFKVVEGKDKATTFNAAYCANKIKNYEKAVVFFSKCIDYRYKVVSAYYYKAKAYKSLKKSAEMIATLEEALKAKPGNSKLEKLYAIHFLKAGVDFQKAGNVVKAASNFNKVIALSSKKWKTDAYLSIGTLYYNNGAKILQKANPYANKNKEKFASEKAKAKVEFNKALAALNKASVINPQREDVKKTIVEIKKVM